MTVKLDQAFDKLRQLPRERQDEWAELISATEHDAQISYTVEQLSSIDEGMADAKAGRFASEEEVQALFDRFRTI